jgi:Zn-dependent protease
LPIIFWISVVLSFDEAPIAMLTITCALIHEMGHILFLLLFSNKNFTLNGVCSGFRIGTSSPYSYKEELFLYLSGPLMNIICAVFSLLLHPVYADFKTVFFALNLATALSNLLPIEGYDGYGALRCLFLLTEKNGISDVYLPRLSFFTLLLLAVSSLYLIDRFGEGYWIFFLFSASLIKKLNFELKKEKNEI